MIDKPDVRVPDYQTYSATRHFLRLIDGQSYHIYKSMSDAIRKQRGTPQSTEHWAEPESWMPQILDGSEHELAVRLWRKSRQIINPRYAYQIHRQCDKLGLLEKDPSDNLTITDFGHSFLSEEFGPAEQQIDYREGLLYVLTLIADQGPGKRADFLPEFEKFLGEYSQYRSQNVVSGAWASRLRNLRDRELVSREGATYQITQTGLDYLKAATVAMRQNGQPNELDHFDEIRRLANKRSVEVHQSIRDALSAMNPYRFEELIKQLLEAIGYDNVIVTSASGDGGVDVTADIEVGITSVREVVQVKRFTRGSVGRPVLDQLRGSLHRFGATRGTIITLSRFSSGAKNAAFEPGAAPITLIDGERLINLLIEHRIGVRKRIIEVLDFEPTDFDIEEPEDSIAIGD